MLGEILNKVNLLRTAYTDAKAAFLDAAISSRAAASTALSTANWTAARTAKLDNLDAAVSSGVGKPPVASGLVGINTTAANVDPSDLATLPEATASETAYDTWKTVLEATSSEGVIQFLNVYQVANASDRDAQGRLTIDGNVVWTSSAAFWNATAYDDYGAVLIGGSFRAGTSLGGIAFGNIRFTDNFKLEFKKTENATGTVEIGARYSYYLTG